MQKRFPRLWALVNRVTGLRVPVYASHTSFFLTLSVFPMLVLLLGLLRYTGLGVDTLTALVGGFLPKALIPAAESLIVGAYRSSSGAVLSLSAATALWSASRGIYGLMSGLNAIYGLEENRGYFYTRALSVAYTFAFLLVLLATLLLQVFGTSLSRMLPEVGGLLMRLFRLRIFVLLAVQTGLFSAMFMALPNRKNRFSDSLPGALLASCGWLVFSDLYSIYVERFSGYANLFGSVYAVALSMLWLYWCICILFYGGALNRFLMQTERLL